MARKTILNEDLSKSICEIVEAGNYVEAAAGSMGISSRSIYTWIEKGNDDIDLGKDSVYAQFAQNIEVAKNQARIKAVTAIVAAFSTDWKAAAHYLERTQWKEWGRKEFVKTEQDTKVSYVVETGVPGAVNSQPKAVDVSGN